MFTGRRFDLETGLYYYRARYYNPQIGRFLQTDPIGYGDGINWYSYCSSNPLNCLDPSGTAAITNMILTNHYDNETGKVNIRFTVYYDEIIDIDTSRHYRSEYFDTFDEWIEWAMAGGVFTDGDGKKFFNSRWRQQQAAYDLTVNSGGGDNDWFFWQLQSLVFMGIIKESEIELIVANGVIVQGTDERSSFVYPGNYDPCIIYWNTSTDGDFAIAGLAHEMAHAIDCYTHPQGVDGYYYLTKVEKETSAMQRQNSCYWWFYICGYDINPRKDYYGSNHMLGDASVNWSDYMSTSPENWYTDWKPDDYISGSN